MHIKPFFLFLIIFKFCVNAQSKVATNTTKNIQLSANTNYNTLITRKFEFNKVNESVIDNSESEHISIYPNPAQYYLFVKSEKNIKSILIYNKTRKLSLQTTTPLIDISELKKGTYYVNIITTNGRTIKQFIKK